MAFAFVQAAQNSTSASGTALVATFGGAVTTGNTLMLVCGYQGGSAEIAISDGANSWTQDESLFNNGLVGRIRVFYKVAATGGFTTVTMTPDASVSSRFLIVAEYSGIASYFSGIYGETDSPGATTPDLISTGNINFTSQPALSFAWGIDGNADSLPPTAGTGYSSRATGVQFGTGVDFVRITDKRITAIGDNAATFTPTAGSHPYASIQLAFIETSASFIDFTSGSDDMSDCGDM